MTQPHQCEETVCPVCGEDAYPLERTEMGLELNNLLHLQWMLGDLEREGCGYEYYARKQDELTTAKLAFLRKYQK